MTSRLINLIGWFLTFVYVARLFSNFQAAIMSMEETGKGVLQQLRSEWVRILASSLDSIYMALVPRQIYVQTLSPRYMTPMDDRSL